MTTPTPQRRTTLTWAPVRNTGSNTYSIGIFRDNVRMDTILPGLNHHDALQIARQIKAAYEQGRREERAFLLSTIVAHAETTDQ